MTIELRPLGVTCNLQCAYCYQYPQRTNRRGRSRFDLDRMKEALRTEGREFTLFGGEPLLLPLDVLKDLFAWGQAQYGRTGVQTNGTLITDAHIALFKTYEVYVGVSLDGPGELNDVRSAGSLRATRRETKRTEAAIASLLKAGVVPSLIVTLHRGNAAGPLLARMNAWFADLDARGVRAARLHILESESERIQDEFSLSDAENISAFENFADLEHRLPHLRFDLFDEMRRLLMGDDAEAACVWSACDPYATPAVHGIEGHGELSNCGRTDKDGVEFLKAESVGYERYIVLYRTPEGEGGCAGCRFFLMCKGQCPGTAIDGDWRNRSQHCSVWRALFARFEAALVQEGRKPLSIDPSRRRIEEALLENWAGNGNPRISQLREQTGAEAS